MLQPVKSGAELIEEIDRTITAATALWWLGHSGFLIRFANSTFFVDSRETEFVTRMLAHRPRQGIRVSHVGEKWVVPEE